MGTSHHGLGNPGWSPRYADSWYVPGDHIHVPTAGFRELQEAGVNVADLRHAATTLATLSRVLRTRPRRARLLLFLCDVLSPTLLRLAARYEGRP